MTSLSQRRSGARNGARLSNLAIANELDRQQREADAKHAEGVERRKQARAAEAARVKFTAADLADAEFVRDEFGWHRVVRVNAKSVTVSSSYSWDERIPLGKVLEFRVGVS